MVGALIIAEEVNMVEIRPAQVDDVAGIAAVIQDVWDDDIDQTNCQNLIDRKIQSVHVVMDQAEVAGFVSGFLTTSHEGIRRWEVDLIAIRKQNQRQGLAPQLLAAAWQDALAHDVQFARGLIHIDNIPSQRSFARDGYQVDETVLGMYLWDGAEQVAAYPEEAIAHLIPVETLTYRGLWLENLAHSKFNDATRQQIVAAARHQVATENRSNTGGLIPANQTLPITETATLFGQYQWWVKPTV